MSDNFSLVFKVYNSERREFGIGIIPNHYSSAVRVINELLAALRENIPFPYINSTTDEPWTNTISEGPHLGKTIVRTIISPKSELQEVALHLRNAGFTEGIPEVS